MRRECRERFLRHRGLAILTCITARASPEVCRDCYLVISFEDGGGENVPGISGACANHKFTYLLRGPLVSCQQYVGLVFGWELTTFLRQEPWLDAQPRTSGAGRPHILRCLLSNLFADHSSMMLNVFVMLCGVEGQNDLIATKLKLNMSCHLRNAYIKFQIDISNIHQYPWWYWLT